MARLSQKLKLHTSVAAQDTLALALEKVRKGTETVKVPVAALNALLRDHGHLCNEVGVEYLEVPE